MFASASNVLTRLVPGIVWPDLEEDEPVEDEYASDPDA